jgi:SAM-dependent methyltransferase
VYIAPRPIGRASLSVGTITPPPGEWGEDVSLLVALLGITELDQLVGRLEGRVLFDASGTWGLVALLAAQHGARACRILTTRPEVYRSVAQQLERLDVEHALVHAFDGVAEADVVVLNVFRRADPTELHQLASRMRAGARMLLLGAIQSQVAALEAALCADHVERLDPPRWINEMVVLSFEKTSEGSPCPPSSPRALPDPLASACWSSLCRPISVPGGWTVLPVATTAGAVPNSTLAIAPSLVYGSGGNALTRAMLRAMAEVPSDTWERRDILDLGCGSGILGIAAGKHGARVTAVETCPAAREAAARNASTNGVALEIIARVPDGRAYDVVLANLDASTWDHFVPQLGDFARPGGHLLGTGITAEHHAAFVERLGAVGFAPHMHLRYTDDGWPLSWFRRN